MENGHKNSGNFPIKNKVDLSIVNYVSSPEGTKIMRFIVCSSWSPIFFSYPKAVGSQGSTCAGRGAAGQVCHHVDPSALEMAMAVGYPAWFLHTKMFHMYS